LPQRTNRKWYPHMRIGVLVFALACILGCCACGHTNAGTKALSTNAPGLGAVKSSAEPTTSTTAPAKVSARVDFPMQIKPILEAKCQPCHFSGGKVYAKMPFDRAETIKTLGTKLFTRIRDENERRLIRDFLTQE
jgi:hypothetical protein